MEFTPFTLPALPKISLMLVVNKPVLFIILGLYFIFYSIVSSVLMYHWSHYGMRSHGIRVGRTMFLFVSGILFLIATMSVTYF